MVLYTNLEWSTKLNNPNSLTKWEIQNVFLDQALYNALSYWLIQILLLINSKSI